MTSVHLDVLGPPDLRVDGHSADVETRKALAVLAYVVLEGPQRRDALDVLLWPESDARRARAALRRTLSALRKAVPDDLLDDGDDVALAGTVTTDLAAVEALAGTNQLSRDPDRLAEAAALFRGDFLAGLHFRDADPFEHWRRDTAERLTRQLTAILERWCRALIDRGDHAGAIEVAQQRLAMDPLHEPSHQQLMLLHAWQGDRAAASRQYAACVQVLDEELGVAPLPRTTALDRAVRAGRIEPPPTRTAPDAEPAGPEAEPAGPEAEPAGADAEPAGADAEPVVPVPFVGRQDELQRLLELHARCWSDGALAVVTGEAGIGKTRLVRELAARVGGRVVHVAAQPGEAGLAYAPVTAALRSVARALTGLDESVRRELARIAPDVAGVRPPSDALVSPGARTRLVDACARALTVALGSGAAPGLLVVDDLGQADRETRDVVGYLTRRLEGRPLLVVVTSRDERRLALPAPALRLALGRLGQDEVEALAAAQDVEADEAARLHAESEGVPYLVVSYLAARRAGATGWELPADSRQLVRSRLAQLDEVAQQVLAAAAVLGGSQPTEVLLRASGRSPDELVSAVEALTAAGLLHEQGDGQHGFTHDKVRAVVLADTSQVRRQLLHRRAADALATTTPPVAAATLAHHLEAAGRQDEAAAAHVAAGRRAAQLYANAEAVDHLEAALALGHPATAELLIEVGELLVRLGRYGQAAQRYTRAAAHGADPVLVEHRLGALALREGRDEAAEAHLRLALDADADDRRRVMVLADLARLHLRLGDLDAAGRDAGAAVAAAEQLEADDADPASDATARAMAHNVAGLVARRRGDLPEARDHLRASLTCADDAEQRAAALNNLALVLGEAGELDEALVAAREALEAGRAVADRHREAALLSNLADLLHAAGRTEEALELQGHAAERFAGVGEAPTTNPEIWQLVDW